MLAGHKGSVRQVEFSPHGRTLASASHDQTARIWDVTTHKERATLTGHKAVVRCLTFSPDGKVLATGSYDNVRLRIPTGFHLSARRRDAGATLGNSPAESTTLKGVASVPASHITHGEVQPFQACAGFGRVTQGSSVGAGRASLATCGLSDAIPLGLRTRRGPAVYAEGALHRCIPSKKYFKTVA